MTVQGMGKQQHETPSHSTQFGIPAAPPSGFTIEEMDEEAAEPGPLRFTRTEEVEVEVHILAAVGSYYLIEVAKAVFVVSWCRL